MAAAARPDGRQSNALRPVRCSRGVLSRADGSARWSSGDTTVVAGVFGPRQGGTGPREDPQRATLEVWWGPKNGLPGPEERRAEAVIRRTLDSVLLASLLPRTRIRVALQVVNDDGSLLSCAINAACTALVHAAIPMATMLSAVQCCLGANGEVLLDPTAQEEQESGGSLLAVFPSRVLEIPAPDAGQQLCSQVSTAEDRDGLISCEMLGPMDVATFTGCVAAARAACGRVDEIMRVSLERSYGLRTSMA